jgi:hypothetical protein
MDGCNCLGKTGERISLGHLGVIGRIILKRILWFRAGCCKRGKESLISIKVWSSVEWLSCQ